MMMNNTGNSRDVILNCSLKLFSERGYESVGIAEITAEAGITKPTLYYFFQSKEGVFKTILEEHYEHFNNILEKTCIYKPNVKSYFEDVYPVLKKTVNTYFNFAKENKTFYLMLLSLSFAPPTAQTTIITKPFVARQYEIVIKMFKNIALHHHNLKGKETDAALNFIAIINANIGFWYQGHTELDDKKEKCILHAFMHGIFS